VAERISNKTEQDILTELVSGVKQPTILPLKAIISKFLHSRLHLSPRTVEYYTYQIDKYYKDGFPLNVSSKGMMIRAVNTLSNWATKQSYKHSIPYTSGGSKTEVRKRTFNKNEMNIILNDITPPHFQEVIRFLYYTGARHGEIRRLKETQGKYVIVNGKSGTRTLKLNHQAQKINVDFDYSKDYVTMTFRRNMKRLKIKDARCHDLRRTFATNLILSGTDISIVSTLLGHSNISTTVKHYAHLLIADIDDFTL
jgi:integrase